MFRHGIQSEERSASIFSWLGFLVEQVDLSLRNSRSATPPTSPLAAASPVLAAAGGGAAAVGPTAAAACTTTGAVGAPNPRPFQDG